MILASYGIFRFGGFILRDGAEFIIGPRFARTRWASSG
jgi:hypothetical protein